MLPYEPADPNHIEIDPWTRMDSVNDADELDFRDVEEDEDERYYGDVASRLSDGIVALNADELIEMLGAPMR